MRQLHAPVRAAKISTSKVTIEASGSRTLARLMSLVIFMSGFSVFGLGAGPSGGGSALRQLIWIMLCLAAAVCSVREQYWVAPRAPRWQGMALALPLLFAAASYGWSYEPDTTLRRAVLFAILILIPYLAFARGMGEKRDFLRIVALPVAALIVLSFLVTALFPSYSITSLGWRGVTSHKNELGQISAVGLMLGVTALVGRRWLLGALGICSAVVLLAMSRSATSGISVVVALSACLAVAFLHAPRSREAKILALAIAALALLAVQVTVVLDVLPNPADVLDKLFALTGKSPTLTGRTDLWQLVLFNTQFHNPLVGAGYGAFWTGLTGASRYIAWQFPGGYVGSAHNGYLDVFNELGYAGLAVLAIFLLTHAYMVLTNPKINRSERLFHSALLLFIVLVNCAESSFWRGTSFLNFMMLASFCRLLGTRRSEPRPARGKIRPLDAEGARALDT